MSFRPLGAAAVHDYADNPQAIPRRMKFFIFGIMAFGQFMALLDIQIVASSLNDIQAGLSAGPDEVSWVQTAYLMAELIMIPFSAFLTQAMSTRWLFACSAGLFTLSSLLCGMAWNIESMIAFRALQGFTGGAMVPIVFSVGFTIFHDKDRAMIPAILGVVSVLAPTLGPTVGGLITSALDWRWIFFINLLPGVAVTLATILFIKLDRPDTSMFRRIDYVHFSSMIVFLAGLQYVLEEGPKHDWFNDPIILTAAWLSAVGFIVFIERAFWSETPVVRLDAFRKYSFSFACTFNLLVGFGMYGSIYLLPLYLGRVRGYDSLEIGTTVFVVGVAQLVSTIIAAKLMNSVDRRIIISIGLVLFATSLWINSSMTSQWGFAELLVPQLVRGLAIMLCIVPSVNMALDGFAGPELRYASGVFNLMRNLGGAVGIAVVNTWLQDNARIQTLRFGEAMGRETRYAEEMLGTLTADIATRTSDTGEAALMAQALVQKIVEREALTIGFDDVFHVMFVMFVLALAMVPFSGKPGQPDKQATAEAH